MNKIIQSLIKEFVQIEVSGKKKLKGTLIDLGTDLLVIFNGIDYMYIPINHIHSFCAIKNDEFDTSAPKESSILNNGGNNEGLSLLATLQHAKGKNSEIYLADDQPLHGSITQIMDDYFEFYSPVYKTMYISTKHLKWLIPYTSNEGPYGLNNNYSKPLANEILVNTFKTQIEKFRDKMVVFNIGGSKSHIGKIKNVEEQIVELEKARAAKDYLNIEHIKTIHQV
ncbi:DUF2642 domain-containing protein [Psychrobacillus sp. INOP01]|uniref:DUF2642 domain-containing protein n=1 Tax=Psychrobacillus sp. INOP01 TaxID=2829187 RepID=UPI001BABF7B4|nr:DUF2642 domain-containing protein [Psychrobacillus sp. INOP01]QUG40884.1 DUF2642 domain-containing protein [Psychrobacillus sp. INOP01]